MYYLTEKQRTACRYFGALTEYTEEQAENAIRFCCSVCGCNSEEQAFLLEWVFDGYWSDMVRFGTKYENPFYRLLDLMGDSYIVTPDDAEYSDYLQCIGETCMVDVTYMDPTGNLLVTNI